MDELIIKLDYDDIIASTTLRFNDDKSKYTYRDEFIFHTKCDFNPYVVFDLSKQVLVNQIQISNRTGSQEIRERGKTLQVKASIDLINWRNIPIVANDDYSLFTCKVEASIRYLHLSLAEIGVLHLKEIQLSAEDLKIASPEYGVIKDGTYYPTHDAGFFSILSTVLFDICKNNLKNVTINSEYTFKSFKDNLKDNNWTKLFCSDGKSILEDIEGSRFCKYLLHHESYKDLEFDKINPVIKHYFSPSHRIKVKIKEFEDKYQISHNNLIGVCFRGTDKSTEVPSVNPEILYDHVIKILEQKSECRVLIQTDQRQVRDFFSSKLGAKTFFLEEMPVTDSNKVMHTLISHNKDSFTENLLAAIFILSKAKYLISNTSNVSYWISLLRGHSNNLYQF